MADNLIQEHHFSCSLSVDGAPIQGLFDKFEGGEVTADGAQTYNAGGMAEPEAIAGVPKTGEVKISRAYRSGRDAPLVKWLQQRINHPAVCGVQPLNPDKTPVPGALTTYRAIITGATTPTFDSNGTSVTMFEVTLLPHGLPS